MISLFLLVLVSPPANATLAPGPPVAPAPAVVRTLDDEEYEKRLEAAGKDVEKLWELYIWCHDTSRDREARSVLRRIVRYDENHTRAREKLGHIFHDGQWFTSERKLEAYKKEEAERKAKEAGLVEYEGDWVEPEDIPFLEEGLVKGPDGHWITPEEAERLEEGWIRQDLEWVSPEEIEKVEAGLWKCGDEWLSLEEANAYHAEIGRWWRIPSQNLVLWTTLTREHAQRAIDEMERALRDLERIYGVKPERRIRVALLRNNEQYGVFASGDQRTHPPTELRARSSLHYAFFAEAWVDRDTNEYLGMGAGYWDHSNETASRFGPHAARLALGLSYAQAIDPSPEAIEDIEKGAMPSGPWLAEFLEEKRIPEWFRYGAAVYTERYYEDNLVGRGGDPWWPRKWSIDNIAARGGLDDLEDIFELELSSEFRETAAQSAKLMNEIGLVTAFLVDGGCEPVEEKLAEVQAALKEGEDPSKEFERLRKEVLDHEDELKEFAGL